MTLVEHFFQSCSKPAVSRRWRMFPRWRVSNDGVEKEKLALHVSGRIKGIGAEEFSFLCHNNCTYFISLVPGRPVAYGTRT